MHDVAFLKGPLYSVYQPVRVLMPCGDQLPVLFFEALARARDGKGVPIKIGEILEAFQDDAGKRELALIMINQALQFLATYGRSNFRVSVNIPPDILDRDFVTRVVALMDRHGLSGGLVFEFLEDSRLPRASWHWLWVLWTRGVMFAVDDYPVNYADMSLVYVLLDYGMPFIVKIDKSRVNEWSELYLLQHLDDIDPMKQIHVVLEGVEHPPQMEAALQLMDALGLTFASHGRICAQGFHPRLGAPLPGEEAVERYLHSRDT